MDMTTGEMAPALADGAHDAPPLDPAQATRVQALAHAFYQVVPHDLSTYCSLTSRISQAALSLLGIRASLLPCQVWLSVPGNNYVVGFLGNQPRAGKWDGHVVCSVGDWFIDAALHHFKNEFDQDTPAVVAARKFQARTLAIARVDLSATHRLVWMAPPPGVDPSPPDEPHELVARYSQALADRVAAGQAR